MKHSELKEAKNSNNNNNNNNSNNNKNSSLGFLDKKEKRKYYLLSKESSTLGPLSDNLLHSFSDLILTSGKL